MDLIMRRFSLVSGPHRMVRLPPSPPAPFDFHPIAPCSLAISIIANANRRRTVYDGARGYCFLHDIGPRAGTND